MSGGPQTIAGQVALAGGLTALLGGVPWLRISTAEKEPRFVADAAAGRWRKTRAVSTGMKLAGKWVLLPGGALAGVVGLIWLAFR